jgi:hypothetical protein
MLKDEPVVDLNTNIPIRLNPPPYVSPPRLDPKEIRWRKFNSGIGV